MAKGKREEVNLEQNLMDATASYMAFEDTVINPISMLDANIYLQLYEILLKLSDDKNLATLLKTYKLVDDEQFLELLKTYNRSLEGKPKFVQYYITIKDFTCNVDDLFSFTRHKTYDKKPRYCIIINKTNNIKIPIANVEIFFNSEDERDREWSAIKQKMQMHEFKNIVFL